MRFKYCVLAAVVAGCITSCAEMRPVTSYYGSGVYRCYYHNTQNRHLFEGVGRDEKEAAQIAQKSCRDSVSTHDEKIECQFDDCVFK